MHLDKSMSNKEIAELFRNVMAVYEIGGGDLFHVRAYENAANSIELYTTPMREIWEEGKLSDVPGIGSSFAKYLDELFRTGRVRHFEKLLAKAPAGMFPLLEIPGVGPKTASKLATVLRLKNQQTARTKLESAIAKGKLTKFLSSGVLARITSALGRRQQDSRRLLLSQAEKIASDVIEYLKTSKAVYKTESLGSLRRHVSTIGDIDLAVATDAPDEVVKHLKAFPHIKKLVNVGEKMATFIHTSGVQIDVKLSPLASWGDMLVHDTGSKLHNIALRTLALGKGMSVSEFGIKVKDGLQVHATEETVYQALGLRWIPPELRENTGEVEASRLGKLPELVELSQIKGDLHLHTQIENYPSSHDMGADPIEKILLEASRLKYEYIGFSDHGPKQSGLSAKERLMLVANRNGQIDQRVKKFVQKFGSCPHVFKGLEIDILPDGRLALEDEALALVDYVIVSVHSGFLLSKADQSRRLLRALSHPKAKILGHPTARQLTERDGINCDWLQIFTYCRQYQKLIEINGTPGRLDLPDVLIKEAGRLGNEFIINTDSHHVSDLSFMKYGVWTAERGWAEQRMVANTRPLSSFQKILLEV